jgi:GTP-binding protein Era
MAGGKGTGHRAGFVGLVGRPNVGKSTMLNFFLGEKAAIVSPRPQTTRQRILGVVTRSDAQVIFLDTPGFHKPQHALGRHLLRTAQAVLEEADVVVVVMDATAGLRREDEWVCEQVRRALPNGPRGAGRPVLLAINKVDAAPKPRLLPMLAACAAGGFFAELIPVSALTGEQMGTLLEEIVRRLPEGPRWYEPHQRTDQPTPLRIAELIREQALMRTRQEVPHAVAVLVERMEERPRVTVIEATLLVERRGQKAILIGRRGEQLKQIGQEARRQIECLLGRQVHLALWVKIEEGWRQNEQLLRELGYGAGGGRS